MSSKKQSAGGSSSGGKAAAPVKRGDNPFEVKHNKPKFPVLGRKVKGSTVKTLKSNTKFTERRDATIGNEFQLRGKTGAFVDRRFGEYSGLSDADKHMMRFQKERLRQSRSIFSLEAGDAGVELTHMGVRLGADEGLGGKSQTLQDDFFFRVGDDDDVGGGQRGLLGEQSVKELHFGGGRESLNVDAGPDGAPARKKSRREIMQEIVAKSKQHKVERKLENQQMYEKVTQLDADFKDVMSLLQQKKGKEKKGRKARTEEGEGGAGEQEQEQEKEQVRAKRTDEKGNAGDKNKKNKEEKDKKKNKKTLRGDEEVEAERNEVENVSSSLKKSKQTKKAESVRKEKEEEEEDSFENLVHELEGISRDARASERLRSKEESAKARFEALKLLETLRERRMKGVELGDEQQLEADISAKMKAKGEELTLEKLKELVQADAVRAAEEAEREGEDGADGDDADDEGNGEAKERKKRRRRNSGNRDWVITGRWKRDVLEEDAALDGTDVHKAVVDAKTGEEFPFVFPVPATFSEFQTVLRGNTVDTCAVVTERMLRTSDPHLNPANIEALRRLQVFLLASCLRVVEEESPSFSFVYAWVEMSFSVIRRIMLMAPSGDDSFMVAFRILLNVASGTEPAMPGGQLYEVLAPRAEKAGSRRKASAALRVQYFDEWHYPSCPFVLVLLQLSRVFSATDLFHPIWTPTQAYLCSVLSSVPHVTIDHFFLSTLIVDCLLPVIRESGRFVGEPFAFLDSLDAWLAAREARCHPHWADAVNVSFESSLFGVSSLDGSKRSPDQVRSKLQALCNQSRDQMVSLLHARAPQWTVAVSDALGAKRTSESSQQPFARLQLRHIAPVAIPELRPRLLLTPSFTLLTAPDEEKTLAKKIKQEKRGAKRELKRDREYLNQLKIQEYEEETAERKQSLKGIMSFLQSQQKEQKQASQLKL